MTHFHRIIGGSACIAWSLLVLPAVRAGVTYTDSDDDVTIIRMTVTPAAEPVPALKYRLVAPDIELRSGNAAPYYYRAFLEVRDVMQSLRKGFDEESELSHWYATGSGATPIADLPLDKLRSATLAPNGVMSTHLRNAMIRRDCDWQLGVEELRGPDTIAFYLDEFQSSREVVRVLVLQTRLAIAEHRFDDAIKTMQINYRLARDVAKVPFLVNGLIGIAEANMANGTVIDLIAQPNSPNLCWAIAELPDPLIDLRAAARFEMDFGPRMFPFIHHAETTDRSPAEWDRLYTQAIRDLSTVGDGSIPAKNQLDADLPSTALALIGYSHAKAHLIADGMDPDRVNSMAVGQVMAIYTERAYQQYANDFEKLWYVPFWEMRQRMKAVETRLSKADPLGGGPNREVLPIVDQLLPAVQACRAAQVRLERDVAALRVIEALRIYAASHAGGLPTSLDEIAEVPVPLNPATGQPFLYRLDGQTASLDLPASDGIPNHNRRFEISIAKPN